MPFELVQRFADLLPEATLVVAGSGQVIAASRHLAELLGTEPSALRDRPLSRLVTDPPESVAALLAAYARTRAPMPGRLQLAGPAGPISCGVEGAAVRPRAAGSEPVIGLRLVPDTPASNPFLALTQKIDELNREVRRRREAEQQARRLLEEATAARAEAEASNRMKDEFLAIVSHELRTPLGAILGWAKVLCAAPPGEDDLREGLAAIERNAVAQVQLIDDLLDISRIITGKLRLEVRPVHPIEVVEAALAAVRPAADARGVRIQTIADTPAPPVLGDPTRLQQVLWNLLTNAVKFTPRGGRVQIVLSRVESRVEIRVVDTGQGIAPEFLPHVFERFRQADSSITRRTGGLGLGLSIVKHLVEMHGGTIRAESDGLGRGATFTACLPTAIAHAGPAPAADTPDSSPASPADPPSHAEAPTPDCNLDGVRVLVVDDQPDARALMCRVLGRCGAVVHVAGSADEARTLIDEARPHVLVSDIGMPDEDGYTLIRHVRTRLTAAELPAAALTAFARADDRRKALLAGFQIHVTKPVDPAELLAVVATLAGRTG